MVWGDEFLADIWTREKRSEVMSKVRSKNNKSTELRLIAQFKYYGVKGWRRNYKVKGKPDFVFHKERVAVFADGCFWHGHNCRVFHPGNNEQYWLNKLEKNRQHDLDITEHLQKLGWRVIRVWECEIKNGQAIKKIVMELRNQREEMIKKLESDTNFPDFDDFYDDFYFFIGDDECIIEE